MVTAKKGINKLKIRHHCENCDLRSENFFCNLREANLKIIHSLKITSGHQTGSTLFMQGQPSNGVYILCQGRVKLSTCSKDGKVIILHIAEPGEILGLSATVTNSVHIATAEVIDNCQINFIRNEDFLYFLSHNAEGCLSAVKQLSNNYQTAYLRICSLGLSASVADKLAMLFLSWCKATCEDHEGIHLKITYTHEEMAQMIGTSRETVTRILKDFKDRKLISIQGSDTVVRDRDELEASIGTKPRKGPL